MSPSRPRRGGALTECLTILAGWLVVVTLAPMIAGGEVDMYELLDVIWYVGSGAK